MKKTLAIMLMVLCAFSVFANGAKEEKAAALKVGMVTDSGTIDDRSFNQGTWEGVARAAKEFGLESMYLRPNGTTSTDYLTAISDLYDQGYRFIACPGYLFAEAVSDAQKMFSDLNIIIIDDALSSGVGAKTVAIIFKEQESGFMAGVATALKLGSGKVGFVGGLEIPAVQKFNWGFQQGIKYANDNLGTSVQMNAEDFVYAGSFADLALGQQLANTMYARGVNAIFAAAGGTGVGVINEAKNRRLSGQDVWVVGVDVDQYSVGDMGNGKSAVLTSAMKDVAGVTYDMIAALQNGTYPSGQLVTLGIAEGRVGIPESNPNLTPEIEAKVKEVADLIKAGKVTISDTSAGLIK